MNNRNVLVAISLIVGVIVGAVATLALRPDKSAEVSALQTQVASADATLIAAQEISMTAVAMQAAAIPTTALEMRTVNEAAATSDFYIAPFEQTEAWLTNGLKASTTPAVTQALSSIPNSISDDIALNSALQDSASDASVLLTFLYEQLASKRAAGSTSPISTCLAIENDIYAGSAVLYLYIQVPTADAKAMSIPSDWKLLDAPLPQSELWISGCYDPDANAQ